MSDWTAIAAILTLSGIYLTVGGILIRTGVLRGGWVTRYRDASRLPTHRYGPLARLPAGIGFTCLGSVILIQGEAAGYVVAQILLGVIGVALLLIALAWALGRAPTWAKPQWLRSAEADGWSGESQANAWASRSLYIFGVAIFLTMTVFIVRSTRPEEWIGPLMLGAGVAVYQLAGRKSRSTR